MLKYPSFQILKTSSLISSSSPFRSRFVSRQQTSRFHSHSPLLLSKMVSQKHPKFGHLPLSTSGPLECALKGTVLLNHPYFNKGSAFTKEERHDFNLSGLLPQAMQTLDQQAKRAYDQYSACKDDLAKNTFLSSMKDQNEVLYFKVRYVTLARGRYVAQLLAPSGFLLAWHHLPAT